MFVFQSGIVLSETDSAQLTTEIQEAMNNEEIVVCLSRYRKSLWRRTHTIKEQSTSYKRAEGAFYSHMMSTSLF